VLPHLTRPHHARLLPPRTTCLSRASPFQPQALSQTRPNPSRSPDPSAASPASRHAPSPPRTSSCVLAHSSGAPFAQKTRGSSLVICLSQLGKYHLALAVGVTFVAFVTIPHGCLSCPAGLASDRTGAQVPGTLLSGQLTIPLYLICRPCMHHMRANS
jgi:hypothetical protein